LYDLEKYNLIKRILFGRKKSIYKLLNQKINCNVRDISNGDVSPYSKPEINVLLEEILNKIGNEFSTLDLILYK
jgi:Fe2+ or Zn2+ uptake regulation protein